MTFEDELRLTFKKCKWAIQELVYDEKMKEWNRLSGAGAMVEYLAKKAPRKLSAIEQHEWAIEELMEKVKERETIKLCQSNNAMYRYLRTQYGGGKEVLKVVRGLTRCQTGPVKSNRFRQRWLQYL